MKIKRIIEIEENDLERIQEIVERENKTLLSVTARGTAYITIVDSKPYYPSGDCISRSELMKAIGTMVEAEMPIDKKWALGLKYSLKVIDNAPTVEPERPQGRWLHNSDRPDTLICSVCNCGWDMWHYESKELKYCPNCGADMRGGKE